MYPTLSKKLFVYGLLLAILVQIVSITKTTAQASTTPFKTTWIATDGSITIPTNSNSGTYSYNINYRKKGTIPFTTVTGRTGNHTISGLTANDTIQVEITGVFPRFAMYGANYASKLLSIDAWGNQVWKSMGGAFWGCSNLTYTAADKPDLTQVTDMSRMFSGCSKFNGSIGDWNTANITNMSYLFFFASSFNQPLTLWTTTKVTNMQATFYGATIFNQDVSSWSTGLVTNMTSMFEDCTKFNQNISSWNTSKVTTMRSMFQGAVEFNQPIGTWNTSLVTDMGVMFARATKFNQSIGNWNTANVTNMNAMFSRASSFNQNLSGLELNSLSLAGSMLDNCGLDIDNYDATLTGWASQTKTNIELGAAGLEYCSAEAARTILTNTIANGGKAWRITGDTKCTPFKTTWIATGGSIVIPTNSSFTYNYTVNYRKKGTIPFTTVTGRTSNYTISGLTNGDTIQVEITGLFPHFYMFNNTTERTKLLSIDAWGNQVWKSMRNSFFGSSNLVYNATDNPDLSSVNDMSSMFAFCSKFNGNIGGWNTSNITNMSFMFSSATNFNQNIGSWNTSNVTNMSQIFQGATKFNYPLTNWNTEKVTDMFGMFSGAITFDQDLSVLKITAVSNMTNMLSRSGLSPANYDATLTGWLSQNKTGLKLDAADLTYCASEAARTTLITPIANGGKGWTIYDRGKGCPSTTPFSTTWKVANNNIIIPSYTFFGRYNYTVNYKKKGTTTYTTLNNQTGNCTISGLTDGDTIQVEITGIFPQFYMNDNATEKTKLLSIDAWGNQAWKSMANAFYGCTNLTYNATDNPNLSSVTEMSGMFRNCSNFNGNISNWNVEKVLNTDYMFNGATVFNQDIGSWKTDNVSNMGDMFKNAMAFNQNIGDWNVGKVYLLISMFENATAFNQDLSKWDMRGVGNTSQGSAENMLKKSGLDCANYSATLLGWANSANPSLGVYLGNVSTNGVNRQYGTNAATARTTLGNTLANGGKGWTITGDEAGTGVCAFAPPTPTASAQSHCQGKTVADLVATGQNIQWYNTPTGGTALTNATVLTAGTYYASQTVSGIESARTSVVVTVNPLTTATVTLSPNLICSGSSGMLTATVTNQGTGFSSVWRINGTDQNVTGLSIGYNASPGEVYSLSLTPGANACPSVATVTASITVTPRTAPKLIITPNIICEGSNETLNVSSSSSLGTNPIYTWRLNGTTVGNSSTLAINNAVLNDVYSISVSPDFDAPGCLMMGTQTITVGCIRSIVSGNWEDPATWNLNRVPLPTDNAVIDNNHNVTITTDGANANKAELRTNSKLIYGNTSAKLKLGF